MTKIGSMGTLRLKLFHRIVHPGFEKKISKVFKMNNAKGTADLRVEFSHQESVVTIQRKLLGTRY